jgi:hypothetical protein
MRSPRILLLASLILGTLATPALAIRPADPILAPPEIDILGGNRTVTAHLARRGDDLEACVGRHDGDFVARVYIRWDRRGRARSVVVSGGNAAFRACAEEALRGKLPITRRRAGKGRASFKMERPTARDARGLPE